MLIKNNNKIIFIYIFIGAENERDRAVAVVHVAQDEKRTHTHERYLRIRLNHPHLNITIPQSSTTLTLCVIHLNVTPGTLLSVLFSPTGRTCTCGCQRLHSLLLLLCLPTVSRRDDGVIGPLLVARIGARHGQAHPGTVGLGPEHRGFGHPELLAVLVEPLVRAAALFDQ